MSKTKLLTGLVIALILLNIGVIGFMLLKKPPHPNNRRGRPGKIIIKKLNFDEKQTDLFLALKERHQSETRVILDEMRSTKNQLFNLLKLEDQSKRDSLIESIGVLQKRLEGLHFQHFADVKAICKPDQINAYNELVSEVGKMMAPGPGHLPPRRK